MNSTNVTMDITPEQEFVYQQLMDSDPTRDPFEALEMVRTYVVPDVDTPARFAVTDMSSANWVLKKLAECDSDEAEVQAMVNREIEAIRARAEKILAPIRRRREFFEAAYTHQLEEFAKAKLDGAKAKSVKLLHGTIGFRKSPARLVIDDEGKAIEYAEQNCPDAIKRSLSVSTLKAAFQNDPFDSDAMHLEPGEESFYFKPEAPSETD